MDTTYKPAQDLTQAFGTFFKQAFSDVKEAFSNHKTITVLLPDGIEAVTAEPVELVATETQGRYKVVITINGDELAPTDPTYNIVYDHLKTELVKI